MTFVGKLAENGWWDLFCDDEKVAPVELAVAMRLPPPRQAAYGLPGLTAAQVCWWILFEHFDSRVAGEYADRLRQKLLTPGTVQFSADTEWVNNWVHAMAGGDQ